MPVKFKFAELDDSQLQDVQGLEDELDSVVLALEPSTLQLASLSEAQIARLKAVESELGLLLLAFQQKA